MNTDPPSPSGLSRRAILRSVPFAGVLGLVGTPATAASAAPAHGPVGGGDQRFRFFTPEEVRTVEALLSRLTTRPPDVCTAVALHIDGTLAALGGPERLRFPHDPYARNARPDAWSPREVYHLGIQGVDRHSQTRFGRLFADLPEARQDEIIATFEAAAQRFTADRSSGSPDAIARAVETFDGLNPGEFWAVLRTDALDGMAAAALHPARSGGHG